jgi:hypothetical protein
MAESVRARRLTDQEGRRLLQIVRRGKHGPVRVRRAMIIMAPASGTLVPAIRRWAGRENAGLCFTPADASRANPVQAQSGPVRTFVMGGSDHRNHPALAASCRPACAGVMPAPATPACWPPSAANAPASAANAGNAGAARNLKLHNRAGECSWPVH